MIKKNLAFTMSEALIVLGIVAVLATLSVIAITNAKPDENIIMYRRAYSNTLKVVQNLMADAQLYPNATTIAGNLTDDKMLQPYSQRLLALWEIGSVSSSNVPQYEYSSSNAQYEIMCMYEEPNVPLYFDNGSSYCLNGKAKCNTGWHLDSFGGACISDTEDKPTTTTSFASSIGLIPSYTCTAPCTQPAVCLASPEDMCCDSSCKPFCAKGTLVGSRCVTIPPTTSSDLNLNTGGITTDKTDQKYDFSTLATSVFGKGFSDTAITTDMLKKYPYLSSATASKKFALSFMSRLNPISSSVSGNTAKFSTADGMYWIVDDHFNDSTPYATVTVQIDGENATACYYNSSSCPAPNKFTFYIEKSGKVHNKLGTAIDSAKDPMACSYARYSNVTKNSKINTNPDQNTCFK